MISCAYRISEHSKAPACRNRVALVIRHRFHSFIRRLVQPKVIYLSTLDFPFLSRRFETQ